MKQRLNIFASDWLKARVPGQNELAQLESTRTATLFWGESRR
jgi:hypothetical protein